MVIVSLKKIKKLFKIFLTFFSIIITLIVLKDYEYSKLAYFVFSVLSYVFILLIFSKKMFFFEKFLLIFLWLGFWFKYSLSEIFYSRMLESGPSISSNNENINIFVNELLFISSFVLMIILFAIYFRKFLTKDTFKYYSFKLKDKNKFFWYLFVVFLIIIIYLCYFNFHYEIYQRGFYTVNKINIFITTFVKWSLIYGALIVLSFLLNLEQKKNLNNLLIFCISILILFFINISIFSRSMILYGVLVLYIYFFYNKNNFTISIKNIFLVGFVLILSFQSIFIVNDLRNFKINNLGSKIDKKGIEKKKILTQKEKSQDPKILIAGFEDLIINRWIGIAQLFAVIKKKENLNIELFLTALNERKNLNKKTFFESQFLGNEKIDTNDPLLKINDTFIKGNTLPGMIAFLYYSGSKIILCIGLIFIYLLCYFVEKISISISNKNKFFVSLVSFLIVYRLINFGYAPFDSYQFLFSMIGCIVGYYILIVLSKKFKIIHN
tara:strand:+ start:206 stop:1687 length:1482 start_codon:yes stop_codon:yes gene_type:complete